MKFLITILQDEDGMFIAECPAIPGCVSQGETEDDAVENIKEAIMACIKVRSKEWKNLFIPTREVEIDIDEEEIIVENGD